MENELIKLQTDFDIIEENYSSDVLNLTLAKTYITRLLTNAKVIKYLSQHHPDILGQFHKICEISTISVSSEDMVNELVGAL